MGICSMGVSTVFLPRRFDVLRGRCGSAEVGHFFVTGRRIGRLSARNGLLALLCQLFTLFATPLRTTHKEEEDWYENIEWKDKEKEKHMEKKQSKRRRRRT